MSGGSMNYLYHLVRDAEFHAHSPEREAFRKHLALVANALRSIEWNDSGDGDDQEVHNIMACISLSASENDMLRAEVERLRKVLLHISRYETAGPAGFEWDIVVEELVTIARDALGAKP